MNRHSLQYRAEIGEVQPLSSLDVVLLQGMRVFEELHCQRVVADVVDSVQRLL